MARLVYLNPPSKREILQRLNKKPLEVGANLIARTAHAALDLLHKLRQETKLSIPLAWEPLNVTETCAIEVYPAATLKAMDADHKSALRAIRKDSSLSINVAEENLESRHCMDAVLCVLAGMDFLSGKCKPPTESEKEIAEKEGWIWVRGR